ncbi:hypothetical protein MMON_37140 [Mycolicibacterium monacense]|uniref:Protein-tyrosine-phosphatase n=2 Tax=Mycolicibacterium monacense TaxID=85693 RepID=A0AAD1IYE9_MYCMB|nr:hypothetical protein MMON_37140 [Mycolicibacterium monacense]
MHPLAARVVKELAGDAARFAARQLTDKLALGSDLILTMTKAHRDSVLELAPRQLHNTFTLDEASRLASRSDATDLASLSSLRARLARDEVEDIFDPIGSSDGIFRSVGLQIHRLLPPIIELTC